MKKILLTVLALLLMAGVASAASIPLVMDPGNQPEIWIQSVHNNDTVALTSGTVVVWAMASDTEDASYAYRTSWIDQSSTADDINVAGVVVSDSIPAGGNGEICIYGPVYALCADSTDAVTADQTVACTTVEGECGQAAAAAVNSGHLGWCIHASPVSTAYGGYGGTDGNDTIMLPIFVNPGVE